MTTRKEDLENLGFIFDSERVKDYFVGDEGYYRLSYCMPTASRKDAVDEVLAINRLNGHIDIFLYSEHGASIRLTDFLFVSHTVVCNDRHLFHPLYGIKTVEHLSMFVKFVLGDKGVILR